jgi:hypothetical protein
MDAPFSEREAWVWMIAEAAWKPREKRVGKVVVVLDRGQLAHSTRFLSDAWQWTHSRVRRFLERLENRHMIERKSGTGVSVICIMKYDTYQYSSQSSGTAPARDPAQLRHSSGTNDNKVNKDKKEEEPKGSLSSVDDAQSALDAYNQVAKDVGWPIARVLSKGRRSSLKARMAEAGGLDGWMVALEKARASPLCRGDNNRGWTADLDFLLQQKSFTRLMEGSYDARPQTGHNAIGQNQGRQNRVDPALEQALRLAGLG